MTPEEMLARLREKPVALSIRAPWSYFILHEGKDVENRVWGGKYRGPIFLHQSRYFTTKGFCEAAQQVVRDGLATSEIYSQKYNIMKWCGHIIGMVEVVDCVTESDSPWFVGPFGFVLANPVAFSVTAPCKGRLGFFRPDCDLSALLLPEAQP